MSTTVWADAKVDTLSAVDARLADFFADSAPLVARHGPLFERLWSEVRLSTVGGKRFRPKLVIDTHRALGGTDQDAAVTVGTAFELLHTAFLLHDDVIDGDVVRRGRLNLIGEFARLARRDGAAEDAAHAWACSAAILAGDLLLLSAQNLIARLEVDARRRIRLLDLLEESVFVTAAGELHDVAYGSRIVHPDLDDVLAMTEWKTAHYSFQAPLVAGAVLAGASEATITALNDYGRHAGIAFQLRDDLLGVFGSENLTGKSTTSDLYGAKLTALAAFVLRSASGPAFASALAERHDRDALERARGILASCGGQSFVEDLIQGHVAAAVGIAGELPGQLPILLARVASGASRRVS